MARGKAVLGLATGATPDPGLRPARRAPTQAGELSFRDVTTYNLDEYYPISPSDPNSYRPYMHEHLFGHVDLAPNRRTCSTARSPRSSPHDHAAEFDRWIEADGGLDMQLLGIGRNGHIGFNEPTGLTVEQASDAADPAGRPPPRHRSLTPSRTSAASRKVIRRALTLGISTILAARSVLILAFGAGKAEAVAEGAPRPDDRPAARPRSCSRSPAR